MSDPARPRLEFVKICKEHIPHLLEIEAEAYPEPWTEGMFTQEVESPISQFFVSFIDDKIVGYIGYWEGVEEAHITSVTVRKEFRGRGYGHDELAFALDHAAKRGMFEAALEVRASNVRAQNLYLSMGFRQIGVRRNYYSGTGEDAWVMVRSLSNESDPE